MNNPFNLISLILSNVTELAILELITYLENRNQ